VKAPCTSDEECGPGERCASGQCVEEPPLECGSEKPCAKGFICQEGECVPAMHAEGGSCRCSAVGAARSTANPLALLALAGLWMAWVRRKGLEARG